LKFRDQSCGIEHKAHATVCGDRGRGHRRTPEGFIGWIAGLV
jgi:hypothetical protein